MISVTKKTTPVFDIKESSHLQPLQKHAGSGREALLVLLWSQLNLRQPPRLMMATALTMPMHFFRMLQMLTSFLENMGAGRQVLPTRSSKPGCRP